MFDALNNGIDERTVHQLYEMSIYLTGPDSSPYHAFMSRLKELQAQAEQERKKRNRMIVALRAEGKSLRVIAAMVGLSAMRCKQIIDRAEGRA